MKEWLEPEEHILTDGEKLGLREKREAYIEELAERLTDCTIQIDDYEFELEMVRYEIHDDEDTYEIEVGYKCVDNDDLNGTQLFEDMEFDESPSRTAQSIRSELMDWIEVPKEKNMLEYTKKVEEALNSSHLYIEFEGKEYEFELKADCPDWDDEDCSFRCSVDYKCIADPEIHGNYWFDELYSVNSTPEEAAEDIKETLSDWIEID